MERVGLIVCRLPDFGFLQAPEWRAIEQRAPTRAAHPGDGRGRIVESHRLLLRNAAGLRRVRVRDRERDRAGQERIGQVVRLYDADELGRIAKILRSDGVEVSADNGNRAHPGSPRFAAIRETKPVMDCSPASSLVDCTAPFSEAIPPAAPVTLPSREPACIIPPTAAFAA